MSRQSTWSSSCSSAMCSTLSSASTAAESSGGSAEGDGVSTPASTPRRLPSSSSSDRSTLDRTPLPLSSSFDTATSSLRVLDAPFPDNLVVRNTFLDFANDSVQELSLGSRARSAEPVRRWQPIADDNDMPAHTSISNVGVGSEGSTGVPYPAGKLDSKISQDSAGALADLRPSEPLVSEMPSVGSVAHFGGQCVPCGFFWKTRGCENGSKCEYCHLCDAREKKRRQKTKKAFFKAQAQEAHD